ncbi:hypothetical protein [Streptomyces avermitilis]|uniref:hypothetical protein n=1 Tax=Streptomyces avermitilis TaxID=33903 RepID=UPI0033BE12EB
MRNGDDDHIGHDHAGSAAGDADIRADQGDAALSAPPSPVGRRAWLRSHRLLVSAVATAVVALAVAIPLTVSDSADAAPCWSVPAKARALAGDPAAARTALDPLDDASNLERAHRLLAHDRVCGHGAEVLGRIVTAATSATASGSPHTMAQARSAFAVASALSHRAIPPGLAPAVARMLAEYVVDVTRDVSDGHDRDATGPAEPAEGAALDDTGFTSYGRFLAPHEAHTNFGFSEGLDSAHHVSLDVVIAEVAKDPEAFAILYDAERTYFAHYLERLTDRAGDPAAHLTAKSKAEDEKFGEDWHAYDTDWPDNDLEDITDVIAALMQARTRYARNGTIKDLAVFDKTVRAHTDGAYRPAADRVTTRPPMGDIAERAPSARVRGDLFDGRQQLFTVYDAWVRDRGITAERAVTLRQLMDDHYVRGLWLTRF